QQRDAARVAPRHVGEGVLAAQPREAVRDGRVDVLLEGGERLGVRARRGREQGEGRKQPGRVSHRSAHVGSPSQIDGDAFARSRAANTSPPTGQYGGPGAVAEAPTTKNFYTAGI